jgi:tetratricopeptide (TPR) repeat protein
MTPLEAMAEPFRSSEMTEVDFAYFQSGLLVDWMVEKKGTAVLAALLGDIGKGVDAVAAIAKRYGPADKVNEEFRKYALDWVLKMGGELRFKASKAEDLGERLVYEELLGKGAAALAKKDWEGARKMLERAVAGAPEMRDAEGAYPMLARVYRELGMEQEEAQIWERTLALMADAPEAHERLLELYSRQKDWKRVEAVCRKSLGVRPMTLRVLESLLLAQEAQGQVADAVRTCRKALVLDPARAPRWNSRLGLLLEKTEPALAKGHLFEALEQNPRDQKALEAFSRIFQAPPPQQAREKKTQ